MPLPESVVKVFNPFFEFHTLLTRSQTLITQDRRSPQFPPTECPNIGAFAVRWRGQMPPSITESVYSAPYVASIPRFYEEYGYHSDQ